MALTAHRPTALITGASSGIGEAFARQLARDHNLVLVARRRDRLEALAERVRGQGAAAEVLAADLAEPAGMAAVAARLGAEPAVDLLVNNAGFGIDGPYWETPLDRQIAMERLHIEATQRLCHAALAAMVPRGRGAIVNVASVAAFVRGPGSGSYGATKSWMTAFTEGLHLDLRVRRSPVAVQALCPGFTYSEFHDTMGVDRSRRAPRAFWLTADQVAAASLRGLARRRLYVIPGWRYALLVAVLTKLPVRLRLAFEAARSAR